MDLTLIYCAGKNRQYTSIIQRWMALGARLPALLYAAIEFADQDYKNPNRAEYMQALSKHRPRLATVLDWENEQQLNEVLSWAEEASQYVSEAVIIIPKVHNGIRRLPKTIGGKQVRLGYSVPSSYGATQVWVGEFQGWPCHLLGGGTTAQFEAARYLDVWSADGNYIHHKIRHGQFFDGKRWVQLRSCGHMASGADLPTAVIELSLPNIVKAWKQF